MAKAMTRIYTADEGEFYDIDRATARELVSKAREEFRGIGLDPRGFIAPAWLLGPEAEAAWPLAPGTPAPITSNIHDAGLVASGNRGVAAPTGSGAFWKCAPGRW